MVGVVMHLPREGRLLAKARTTIGRMRGVCPDLDRSAFTSAMRAAQRALSRGGRRRAFQAAFHCRRPRY
jgi:hypothetical protein